MFANFLIGLREGLEASLVVGILVAYLVRTGHRDRLAPLWAGVATAVGLSFAVVAGLTLTSRTLGFRTQETFGGVLSIVAVCFVTWMVFWMRRTARGLKGELEGRLGHALALGGTALAATAFIAVGREGLETALFVWSAAQATGSTTAPLLGAVLGLATAAVLGWLLYKRSVALNLKTFFTWTGLGLVVVAAGVLAYAMHDLQEAGRLPGLNAIAFDATRVLPPGSWYGSLVKGIFSISAAPTWLELAAFVAYLVPVLVLFLRDSSPVAPPRPTAALVLPLLLLGGCAKASHGGGIAIRATDRACDVATTDLKAGPATFHVTNKGSQVTEVYVYAGGNKVVGERENIGPGTSADLAVTLDPGTYEVACKPGQTGTGIRRTIHVTGPGGATSAKAADREVAVTAKDYSYGGLAGFSARQGETIRFELANRGPADHELEVLGPDGTSIGEVGPTAAGLRGDVTLTFARPGTYAYRCGIADHAARGMKGTFTVTGG